jgi:hypothetical protein
MFITNEINNVPIERKLSIGLKQFVFSVLNPINKITNEVRM